MKISISYPGCYEEYREFFTEMANCFQSQGHQVGIITGGVREGEKQQPSVLTKDDMLSRLGFIPDFCYVWGQNESVANGNLWKAERMEQEAVDMHFDDDATDIKKYTGIRVMKVLNPGQKAKF